MHPVSMCLSSCTSRFKDVLSERKFIPVYTLKCIIYDHSIPPTQLTVLTLSLLHASYVILNVIKNTSIRLICHDSQYITVFSAQKHKMDTTSSNIRPTINCLKLIDFRDRTDWDQKLKKRHEELADQISGLRESTAIKFKYCLIC